MLNHDFELEKHYHPENFDNEGDLEEEEDRDEQPHDENYF